MSSIRKSSSSPFSKQRDVSPVKMKQLNLQAEKMLRMNQLKNQSIAEELSRNNFANSSSSSSSTPPLPLAADANNFGELPTRTVIGRPYSTTISTTTSGSQSSSNNKTPTIPSQTPSDQQQQPQQRLSNCISAQQQQQQQNQEQFQSQQQQQQSTFQQHHSQKHTRGHQGFSSFSNEIINAPTVVGVSLATPSGQVSAATSANVSACTSTANTPTAAVAAAGSKHGNTAIPPSQCGETPKFQKPKNEITSLSSFSVFDEQSLRPEEEAASADAADAATYGSAASCFSFGNEPDPTQGNENYYDFFFDLHSSNQQQQQQSLLQSQQQQLLLHHPQSPQLYSQSQHPSILKPSSSILDAIPTSPSSQSLPSIDGIMLKSTTKKKQVSFCPPIVHCFDTHASRSIGSSTSPSTSAAVAAAAVAAMRNQSPVSSIIKKPASETLISLETASLTSSFAEIPLKSSPEYQQQQQQHHNSITQNIHQQQQQQQQQQVFSYQQQAHQQQPTSISPTKPSTQLINGTLIHSAGTIPTQSSVLTTPLRSATTAPLGYTTTITTSLNPLTAPGTAATTNTTTQMQNFDLSIGSVPSSAFSLLSDHTYSSNLPANAISNVFNIHNSLTSSSGTGQLNLSLPTKKSNQSIQSAACQMGSSNSNNNSSSTSKVSVVNTTSNGVSPLGYVKINQRSPIKSYTLYTPDKSLNSISPDRKLKRSFQDSKPIALTSDFTASNTNSSHLIPSPTKQKSSNSMHSPSKSRDQASVVSPKREAVIKLRGTGSQQQETESAKRSSANKFIFHDKERKDSTHKPSSEVNVAAAAAAAVVQLGTATTSVGQLNQSNNSSSFQNYSPIISTINKNTVNPLIDPNNNNNNNSKFSQEYQSSTAQQTSQPTTILLPTMVPSTTTSQATATSSVPPQIQSEKIQQQKKQQYVSDIMTAQNIQDYQSPKADQIPPSTSSVFTAKIDLDRIVTTTTSTSSSSSSIPTATMSLMGCSSSLPINSSSSSSSSKSLLPSPAITAASSAVPPPQPQSQSNGIAKSSPQHTTQSSSPLNDSPSPLMVSTAMTFSTSSSSSCQQTLNTQNLSYSPLLKCSPVLPESTTTTAASTTQPFSMQQQPSLLLQYKQQQELQQQLSQQQCLQRQSDENMFKQSNSYCEGSEEGSSSQMQISSNQCIEPIALINANSKQMPPSTTSVGLYKIDLEELSSGVAVVAATTKAKSLSLSIEKQKLNGLIGTGATTLSSFAQNSNIEANHLIHSNSSNHNDIIFQQFGQPRNLPRPSPMPIIFDYSKNQQPQITAIRAKPPSLNVSSSLLESSSSVVVIPNTVTASHERNEATAAKKSLDNSLELIVNPFNNHTESLRKAQKNRKQGGLINSSGDSKPFNSSVSLHQCSSSFVIPASTNVTTAATATAQGNMLGIAAASKIRNISHDRIQDLIIPTSIHSSSSSSATQQQQSQSFSSTKGAANFSSFICKSSQLIGITSPSRQRRSGQNTPTSNPQDVHAKLVNFYNPKNSPLNNSSAKFAGSNKSQQQQQSQYSFKSSYTNNSRNSGFKPMKSSSQLSSTTILMSTSVPAVAAHPANPTTTTATLVVQLKQEQPQNAQQQQLLALPSQKASSSSLMSPQQNCQLSSASTSDKNDSSTLQTKFSLETFILE